MLILIVKKKHIIKIHYKNFGVDKDNNSVSLKVKDFKPRFIYIFQIILILQKLKYY